jgi:hypothetical protein
LINEPYKSDKPTNARMAACAVVLIAVIAFTVFTHYRLIQPTLPVEGATAQDLRRDKESRKKQNPVTISQFMGKPYAQG